MMSDHVWSFPDCGGSCGLCPGSGSRRGHTSPSGVYPAGGLRWHFTCCFGLCMVCGWDLWSYGSFLTCGGSCELCLKSRTRRTCPPHLLRFILLVSFSDTLHVVSILGIAYDCHLLPFLQS